MPRKLQSRKKQMARKAPPSGRKIVYVRPHSPFQKLLDGKRIEKGLSLRELATKTGFPLGSIYALLHNLSGYPSPRSCSSERIQKISEVLGIPVPQIKTAIDASRQIFAGKESPVPQPKMDRFREFIDILKNDKRKTARISSIVSLAERFYGD